MFNVTDSCEEPAMTKIEVKPAIATVNELFSKSPDGLREIVRAVMQEMLEAEMTDALGAGKGERTAARLGYRSGYYARTLITRVGKLELRVPQDRDGRFSTELFERYQRSEQALVATLAAEGQGHHRGIVRPRLLGLLDLGDQQAPGREPQGLCRAPTRRALSLPHPRCAL